MKKVLIVLITISFISCKEEVQLGWNSIEYYKIGTETEKKYWATSQTVYGELGELLHDDLTSANDSVAKQIIKHFDEIKVDENGYSKITELFLHNNEILQEASFNVSATVCEPVYRDILIFKNNKKIVGIAKVCFECGQNNMVFKTKHFRDNQLDYGELSKALSRLADR